MPAIASVLVHLDGTSRAETRMTFARDFALHHKSALQAIFAVAPRYMPLQVPMPEAVPAALAAHVEPAHRVHARSVYERCMAEVVPSAALHAQWHELEGEPPTAGFVSHALLSDLLVLGQRDPHDAAGMDVPADFVESVIIESGRPAIVLPRTGKPTPVFHRVLVGWKPSREAARAVTSALPLLRDAKEVHVFCGDFSMTQAQESLSNLVSYLRLHGVAAVKHFGLGDDQGPALLATAGEVGADLVVMGCYGHTRLRELFLGGATRAMLDGMRAPVFMAH